MTIPVTHLPRNEVRGIRGGNLVCALHRILPMGRKYAPLLKALNGSHGLLSIPFAPYQALMPAVWAKSATTHLLSGSACLPEFQVLRPLLQSLQRGTLIDAGANIGLFTLLMRSASPLPIIAYEPQPFLFKLLNWNIEHNQLADVNARNLACGAQPGAVAFSLGLNGSVVPEPGAGARPAALATAVAGDWTQEARIAQAGQAVVEVPVTTLDEDLADVDFIALLKIDCEGFEYQIVQGAREVIRRHRPMLFIEVHPTQLDSFGHSTRELLDLLTPGYELEFWYFHLGRHASKLARSWAQFKRPKAHRCASAAEMLTAATSVPGPAQIYFLGRPMPPG